MPEGLGAEQRTKIHQRAGRNVRKVDLWKNSRVLLSTVAYLLDTQTRHVNRLLDIRIWEKGQSEWQNEAVILVVILPWITSSREYI